MHSVVRAFQARTAREELHVRDVHAVHRRAVIRQQRSQGAPYDFRPVDDCDRAAVESIPVWQDGIVDPDVFEDFDGCEGRTGED